MADLKPIAIIAGMLFSRFCQPCFADGDRIPSEWYEQTGLSTVRQYCTPCAAKRLVQDLNPAFEWLDTLSDYELVWEVAGSTDERIAEARRLVAALQNMFSPAEALERHDEHAVQVALIFPD